MKPLNLIALLLFLGGALWALTRSDRVVRSIQATYYSAISPFLHTGSALEVRAREFLSDTKNAKVLENELRQTRSDFRTLMISTKEVRSFFNSGIESPTAVLFAIDQAPANPRRSYWMNFLNQETGVHFGAEKFAFDYNMPVYHAHLSQKPDGMYSLKFELISTDPRKEKPGYITEKATQLLESQIMEHPEFWLWSHKRWKHKRPSDIQLQQLVTEHAGRQ